MESGRDVGTAVAEEVLWCFPTGKRIEQETEGLISPPSLASVILGKEKRLGHNTVSLQM